MVFLLLFCAGLSAGFIDAIAGGGGLISVPALMWAGLPVPVVLGTNKMQSSCGTLLAVLRYVRAGLVGWSEARLTMIVTFVSALLGTWAVTRISPELLKHLVPWLLLGVAVYALLSPRMGTAQGQARVSSRLFAFLAGLPLGFYDGFFGPGVGAFWTMALLTLRGQELTRATAFCKVVNLASNIAALLVFILAGTVHYQIALVMILGQLIGARLGAGLVLKHGAPFVRVVFLLVVFALTAKLIADQLGFRL